VLRARKRSQIWRFAVPRLAPARLARVLRVGQKRRAQAVAARAETRHARKNHAHVAVKVAMPRARMTNADAVAKVVPRRVVKVVQHREAKVAPLPAVKAVRLPATKVALSRVARVALERGWKLPLVVAVTRSHRLRAADQPSHRVHPDR
jgi:acetolactate synthase regulatory subunit